MVGRLIAELDETRWTGPPGYPLRAMVGVALAKSLYSIPTWTRFARVLDRLHRENPDLGRDLAIDASHLPAYANGQRYLSKNGPERERYSYPDASWGHRSAVSTRKGGGFYGYRVHAAVCARLGASYQAGSTSDPIPERESPRPDLAL